MGIVTEIQRFSLNDGPGIRTTVFLKGCDMRCAWCHNPETCEPSRQMMIYPERCIGCNACVRLDETKARSGLPPPRESLQLDDADGCFSGALRVVGQEMAASAVMEEIIQDCAYYEASGGGVTISGGEAMTQPAFVKELLTLCREHGVQGAVETNLAYTFDRLAELAGLLDLVMADVKIFDPASHRRWTGVGNERILENVKSLRTLNIPVILRTPVIPGVNDNNDEIIAISRYIADNVPNLMYYELLNFNPLGDSKYRALGLDNPFAQMRPLSAEDIERLADAARSCGIPVRVG
ncbi:MAG: glycyl-radical enzyme activating protein [Oscillospiraceae bacterium]|jgi:pyruvate formate lyase activating enzyme|nr:glycyl-radical enzyme activating protein [Oscillospiraceae bacterium]